MLKVNDLINTPDRKIEAAIGDSERERERERERSHSCFRERLLFTKSIEEYGGQFELYIISR